MVRFLYLPPTRSRIVRDDLTKVLCERERTRSWDHYSNYRNLDKFERQYDDAFDEDDGEPFTGVGSGYRESMKHRYGYDTKSFGEHLSPLYGIVRKNVGRKWDKVYGELKQAFDARSTTGNHIFQHLYDQLANPADTYIGEDGKVWVRARYFGGKPIRESYFEFYVDPRDGILKRNLQRKTYRQVQRQRALEKAIEDLKTRRVIDTETELHFITGVWFEVKFRTFNGKSKQVEIKNSYSKSVYYRTELEYPLTYDVLQKRTVQSARVAISKRTVNHRELKRFGLVV
jgi:hypothetical protein